MMPLNTFRSSTRLTPRDLGKKGWILSSCSSLSQNKPSILPPPEPLSGGSPHQRGSPHSLWVLALVVDGTHLKVYGWYDNEWGYSCRMADLACAVGRWTGR